MKNIRSEKESYRIVQLIMLISMTALSSVIVVFNRLLNWELWTLPVIVGGTVICWWLHLQHISVLRNRIYASAFFIMFEVFYYTVKINTVFDSGAVLVITLVILSFSNEKPLFWSGFITAIAGMIFHLILAYNSHGIASAPSDIVRIVIQFVMFILMTFLIYRISFLSQQQANSFKNELKKNRSEKIQLFKLLTRITRDSKSSVTEIINASKSIPDHLNNIKIPCSSLMEELSQLEDFSTLALKKTVEVRNPYNIVSLTKESLEYTFSMTDTSASKAIIVDLDPSLPSKLNGDAEKLKKILWYSVDAAYKFTESGGIYVRIRPVSRSYGINLIIEVEDTGIGMTDEVLETVYDVYSQRDTELGVGIDVVTGFTACMGGTINITGKPDYGSTVRVSIPQETLDDTPCISVNNEVTAALFLDFSLVEHPRVRGFYMRMISHIEEALSIKFVRIQSLHDFDKAFSETNITHLIIDTSKYIKNKNYIDNLSSKINVALVKDSTKAVSANSLIRILDSPFLALDIADFLNNKSISEKMLEETDVLSGSEIAEDSSNKDPDSLLRNILELDMQKGMDYCADDMDFYYELLEEYASDNDKKILELENAYDKKDWDFYAIKVHAIKSTSDMIGANNLYESAKELEAASKEKSESKITSIHTDFINSYKDLMEKILEVTAARGGSND